MYGQGKHAWSGQFHYYKFIISMSNFNGSCNTAEDSGGRICVPNKMEDVNFKVFTMIEGINKPKMLAQHISWDYKCEFDDRECNSRRHCQCESKNN